MALKGYNTVLHGRDNADAARTCNNLAILLSEEGETTQARLLYERALRSRETTLGKNHPDTLDTMNNLANIFYAARKYIEAKKLYEQATVQTQY